MTRETKPSGDDRLEPLLEAARYVEPVSNVARARSLARARARLAAGPNATRPRRAPTRASRGRRSVALAAVLVLTAAGTAAALLRRAPPRDRPEPQTALPVPRDVPREPTAGAPARPDAPRPNAIPAPSPGRAVMGRQGEGRPGELAVLRRAQAAYANGDYPAVVDIIGKHARRFSNGRLAEEAEALRVRSLARCGRGGEAERALDAFARRFPQSVLLPALRRSVGSEP